jgi:hypothetical protein
MEKGRRELLKKVPTRTLLASIKMDMKKALRSSAGRVKPKEK